MRRLRYSIPTAALLALGLALGGGAAGAADPPHHGATTVPDGFSPAATSWVSPQQGWVLGYAPCAEGSCASVLHTMNGGSSWSTMRPPGLHPSEFGNVSHLVATQSRWVTTLVASNTEETVISTDGGGSWRPVDLPADAVGDLAATSEGIYLAAHTAAGDQLTTTTLWRTPGTRSSCEPVPGVSAEVQTSLSSVMSDIAVDPGGPRLVGETGYGTPAHAWAGPDATDLEEIDAPCGELATQFFGFADEAHQYVLCSENPGRGRMAKELRVSGGDGSFDPVGTTPPDQGLTSDFATAGAGVVAIGATGGDAGIVHMTFDRGQTWETTLFAEDTGPVQDLAFQDPDHGVLVAGYASVGTSVVFRTEDGGHTWEPLDL